MTGALSLMITLFAAAGLGAWLPIRSIGGRLFVGIVLTTASMNLIHFTLALPISATGWIVLALALPGLARIAMKAARDLPGAALKAIVNPGIALTIVAGAVMMARGFDTYSLYSWDEFASWVYWSREAYAADTFFAPQMGWQSLLYSQGWPMAALLPQTPFERFEPARSIAVAIVWHAALLGLFYDALRAHIRIALPSARTSLAPLLSWAAILALLALEATWTLAPQLLLIEKPQIYMLSGSLAFVLAALASDDETPEQRWYLLGAGLALAGAYLVKVTALGAVLPVALAILLIPVPSRADGRRYWHTTARRLGLLFPVAIAYFWWAAFRPFEIPPGCLADPFALTVSGGDSVERILGATERLMAKTGSYLLSYKSPLSLVATAGLIAAVFDRRLAPVAWAIIAYAAIYFLSLIPLYVWCYSGGYELANLESLQRYLRVPLRIFHLFGPGLLLIAVGRVAGRIKHPALAGWLSGGSALAVLSAVVVAASMLQVLAINSALRNAAVRDREPQHSVETISKVNHDADRLIRLIGSLEFPARPRVSLIAQGKVGFEHRIGRYRSLSDRRGPRFLYRLGKAYSWGPEPKNPWMNAVSAEDLTTRFRKLDILWPLKTDPWIRTVIRGLVSDNACAEQPEAYFLVRNPGGVPDFRCIPKDTNPSN